MTVTNVRKDPAALSMTLTVELDASVERAWQLWADPRQLDHLVADERPGLRHHTSPWNVVPGGCADNWSIAPVIIGHSGSGRSWPMSASSR